MVKYQFNTDDGFSAGGSLPEIHQDKQYENIYQVGEWSFDIRDDYDEEYALKAVHSWIAWYLFISNITAQKLFDEYKLAESE